MSVQNQFLHTKNGPYGVARTVTNCFRFFFVSVAIVGSLTVLSLSQASPAEAKAPQSTSAGSSTSASSTTASSTIPTVEVLGATQFGQIEAEAATYFDLTNTERSRRGIRPLVRNAELDAAALRWAQVIGNSKLRHAADLSVGLSDDWRKLGENLGRGPAPLPVHQALMESPKHRANLLDPSFTQIGIAVVETDLGLLVVQRFRQPQSR